MKPESLRVDPIQQSYELSQEFFQVLANLYPTQLEEVATTRVKDWLIKFGIECKHGSKFKYALDGLVGLSKTESTTIVDLALNSSGSQLSSADWKQLHNMDLRPPKIKPWFPKTKRRKQWLEEGHKALEEYASQVAELHRSNNSEPKKVRKELEKHLEWLALFIIEAKTYDSIDGLQSSQAVQEAIKGLCEDMGIQVKRKAGRRKKI